LETYENLSLKSSAHSQGIAEITSTLSCDLSHIDFTTTTNLSTMYTANDLVGLFLEGTTNLDGSAAVALSDGLDSLDWLDVTGL
jgi:hypothetical protein